MLVIGPGKLKKDSLTGGVVVLFEQFLSYLKNNKIPFKHIDITWQNYSSKVMFILVIYFKFILGILFLEKKTVSFHGTSGGFTYFAPVIVLLCKVTHKRITLRKFGGNFDLYYENLPFYKKLMVYFALNNADVVFFETKYLITKFHWVKNPVWFPNTRVKNNITKENSSFSKKIIFLGHIRREKGVNELIEAANILFPKYKVDLYGSLTDTTIEKKLTYSKANYKGALKHELVIPTISKYDILVLPSYNEGYPGVLIEGMSVGLPIIASALSGILEMIADGKNGFLIEPQSVESLVDGIKKITERNYKELSTNALKAFENFDQNKVMKRILKYL